MIPGAAEIVVGRWRLAAWLRVFSIAPLMLAIPALGSWLAEGIQDDDLWDYGYYAGRIIFGIGGCALSAIMFLLAPLMARVLLPVPAATLCPRCRYEIAGAVEGRCPECGLDVGDEFIAAASEPGDYRRPPPWSRLLDDLAPATFLLGWLWSLVVGLVLIVGVSRELGIMGFLIALVMSLPILLSQTLALRMIARGPRQASRAAAPPLETPWMQDR